MRYGELFAGAGGMSLGLERAGMSCAFHAEIADFPRRVLRHRWPDAPLYGDVAQLDGRALITSHGAIDLLAGGSPCQDLSVAGRRAGLGGARSGLFFEQLRLWDETGATYLLWENVAGALSSNNGKDFAAVLSAIVGATVVVPRDGWGGDESGGGVAAGPRAVAAWRLLDAQYFGVPQRRLRVFVLGARAGGVDPAEVLLEPEGVRRNPPTRGEAGEGAAARAGDRPESASGLTAFDSYNQDASQRVEHSLRTGGMGDAVPAVLSFGWQNGAAQGDEVEVERVAPLRVKTTPAVMAFSAKDSGADAAMELAPTLRAGGHTESHENGGVMPAVVSITGDVTHALTHEGHDTSEDGTGRGTPIVAYFDKQRLGEYAESGLASTVSARDYKDATDLVVPVQSWDDECNAGEEIIGTLPAKANSGQSRAGVLTGVPRRLMPVETERLMGWPDGWTDVPDEKGKPASDAVRYKACGNGVVSHVAEWIAARLIAVEAAAQEAA